MVVAILATVTFLVLDLFLEFKVHSKVKLLKTSEQQLSREAAEYRKAAEKFSNPTTFLRSAKLKRKAIALEGDCKSIKAQQDTLKQTVAIKAVQAAKLVICFLAVICSWQQPAIQLHPSISWPMGRWLQLPPGNAMKSMGAITILPWISLSHRASAAVVAGLLRFKQRLS